MDTRLSPQRRIRTIEILREAGLDWYNSCEPIGPEHTPQELAAQICLGATLGCRQHAAMRRFPVPGSPLFKHGRLPLVRLAQIVAVVALASVGCETTQSIAVHEPNLLGLMSGANALYPEAGEPDVEEQLDPCQPDPWPVACGFQLRGLAPQPRNNHRGLPEHAWGGRLHGSSGCQGHRDSP